MEKPDVAWNLALSVWWSYTWRAMLAGFALGVIVALTGIGVAVATGVPSESILSLHSVAFMGGAIVLVIVLTLVGMVALNVWALKAAMSTTHAGMAIKLKGVAETAEGEFTLTQILSFWWSFSWRSVVVSILVGLVLGVAAALAGFGDNPVFSVISTLVSLSISVWAFKEALALTYGGATLTFVAPAASRR